jgi:hypothetical protein
MKPHMTSPRVTRCGDGHYRRVIYGLGPYIADYPEQALLACVVQGWCPKCVSSCHILSQLPDGSIRCCAPADQLDSNDIFGLRSHLHTDALLDAFSCQELWDGYGIVANITACISLSHITSSLIPTPAFYSIFPTCKYS